MSLTYEDGEGERQALAIRNSDLRSENLALRQEVERLRAEVESLATEIDHLWIPSAEKWMEETNRLRAAGDALVKSLHEHITTCEYLGLPLSPVAKEVIAAWEEARRG